MGGACSGVSSSRNRKILNWFRLFDGMGFGKLLKAKCFFTLGGMISC